MRTILDMTEVDSILQSGDFDHLLRSIEHETLECKREIYAKTAVAKIELLKDVSALANSRGGHILLGVHTTSSALHKGDEIVSFSPFPQDLCDLVSYKNIVNSGIYPSFPQHLRVTWHPSKTDSSKGIVSIRVAPECKSGQPYLVSQVEAETGITTGKLFGFYQRIDDDARPMTVQELRELLKRGIDSGAVLERLGDIQITVAEALAAHQSVGGLSHETTQVDVETKAVNPLVKPSFDEDELHRRFNEAKQAAGLIDVPLLVLAAYSTRPTEYENMFASRNSNEAKLLERPPSFKHDGGFDLNTHQQSQMVQAKLLRCIRHQRKDLELWKDGLLLFVGRGDADFLGWFVSRYSNETFLINNIALTEVVTVFFLLCEQIYKLASPVPSDLYAELALLSDPSNSRRYELGNHVLHRVFVEPGGNTAPDFSKQFQTRFSFENMDAYAEAFRLLRQVYNWFGYTDEEIPYQELSESGRSLRINKQHFVNR